MASCKYYSNTINYSLKCLPTRLFHLFPQCLCHLFRIRKTLCWKSTKNESPSLFNSNQHWLICFIFWSMNSNILEASVYDETNWARLTTTIYSLIEFISSILYKTVKQQNYFRKFIIKSTKINTGNLSPPEKTRSITATTEHVWVWSPL